MDIAYFLGEFMAGFFCAGTVGGGLVYLVYRRLRNAPRSYRLGCLSLSLGLAYFLIMFVIAPKGKCGSVAAAFAMAVLVLVMGIGGVVAGIAALSIRRRDHGTGLVLPLIGILASLGHLFLGFCLFVATLGFQPPDPSDFSRSWVHVLPEHGVRLRLPTGDWQAKQIDGKAGFEHMVPVRMMAIIEKVERLDTEDDFRASCDSLRQSIETSPQRRESAVHELGINLAGNPTFVSACTDKDIGGAEVFIAGARIWLKDKGLIVHLSFEAKPSAITATFARNEQHTFEKSAMYICSFVE